MYIYVVQMSLVLIIELPLDKISMNKVTDLRKVLVPDVGLEPTTLGHQSVSRAMNGLRTDTQLHFSLHFTPLD